MSTIDSIKKDLNNIRYSNNIERYAGSLHEKISKCIEDEFKETYKTFKSPNQTVLKHTYLSGEQFRKRKKVLASMAEQIASKYKDKYSDLSIEYELISLNAEPLFSNYDVINNHEFIFEAAALYILYEIDNINKLDELKKILPKGSEIDTAIINDDAEDLCFSNELICSLVYLLQEQFQFDEKNDVTYILTRKYTLNNNESQNEINNKVKQIFSLLDQDIVNDVVHKFKDDLWSLFEMVLEIQSSYQKNINDFENKIDKNISRLSNIEKDLNNALLVSNNYISNSDEALYLTDEIAEQVEVVDDLYNTKHLFRLAITLLYEENSILKEEIEDNIQDKVYAFEIDDPFETMFAFAYLLTYNDDTIWLINMCQTLLKIAAQKLPWNKDFNINRESNEEEQKLFEKRIQEFSISDQELIKEIRDYNKQIYSFKYTDAYRWQDLNNAKEDDLLKWNLPQFLFEHTGIILPRYLIPNQELERKLLNSNFKEEEIYILRILMGSLASSSYKESLLIDDEKDNEIDKNVDDVEELKQINKKRKNEINSLKTNYTSLNTKYNALKKEFEVLSQTSKSSSDELNQLRQLVYELQNENIDDSKDKEQNLNISFPYKANKKTVVVGGSDTWINKLKEKLENVIFLSSSTRLNQDVLKSAESIWIQTISLKHADFYAITSYNNKHHIPINYFSCSNIDRCLKQFIEKDNQ